MVKLVRAEIRHLATRPSEMLFEKSELRLPPLKSITGVRQVDNQIGRQCRFNKLRTARHHFSRESARIITRRHHPGSLIQLNVPDRSSDA